METFSALLALCAGNSPVPGEFPAQRPLTRRFDVFFDLRLNKRLSKQSWGWWFETSSRPLWRQCNVSTWYMSVDMSRRNEARKILLPFYETTSLVRDATLLRRHNERDGVPNHRRLDCLLHLLFRRRSKKTSTLHVTGLCAGNSPVPDDFPAQRASNTENVPFDDVITTNITYPIFSVTETLISHL